MAPARRVLPSGSAGGVGTRRRPRLWRWIPLLVVAAGVCEALFLWFVADKLGIISLLVIAVLATLVGLWLLKREGPRAWRAVRSATREGRVPAPEAISGILVLLAGVLLLFPGLLTDLLGVCLLLPPVRAAIAHLVARRMQSRVNRAFNRAGLAAPAASWGTERVRPWPVRRRRPMEVVEGEIIDD